MAAMMLATVVWSVGGKAAETMMILIGSEPVKAVILQYDKEGFTFRPLDVAEPVYLPWHTLSRSERERLQKYLGLAGGEEHVETHVDKVDGVIVRLKRGPGLKGVLLPERETEDAIYIQTARTPFFEVKKDDIQSVEKARLPENEVYSLEMLYDFKHGEIKPATARDHFEMARWCMKVTLYDKARDHLVRCTIMDPLYKERTKDMLEEIELSIKEKRAGELYDRITVLVAAQDYIEVIRLIKQLQTAYPDSPRATEMTFLLPEIEAKKEKVLRRELVGAAYLKLDELIRRRVWGRIPGGKEIMGHMVLLKDREWLKGKLVSEDDQMVILESDNNTYKIARDQILAMKVAPLNLVKLRDATFAECKEYVSDADGGIMADLMAALSSQFRTSEEEAKKIWGDRAKRTITFNENGRKVESPSAMLREARYGAGTWLREDGSETYTLKYGQKTTYKTYTRGSGDQRYTYGRNVTTPTVDVYGGGSDELEQDADKWWARLPRQTRHQILRAVCADGVMEVVREIKERCPSCGGKGHDVIFDLTGSAMQKTCRRCRGLKYTVTLRYR